MDELSHAEIGGGMRWLVNRLRVEGRRELIYEGIKAQIEHIR